jgi:hypothetical protein
MLNLSLLGCLEVVVLWLETKQKTSFNEMNGFLSLQLELRLELGLQSNHQSINLFNLTLVIMVTILPADILIYTTLFEASLSPVENLRWLDWNVPGYPLFHFGLEH